MDTLLKVSEPQLCPPVKWSTWYLRNIVMTVCVRARAFLLMFPNDNEGERWISYVLVSLCA